MQVAEILSDLTSLQVCDSKAALELISTRPSGSTSATANGLTKDEDSDPDLKRAHDLLELHAAVKVAHQDGTDKGLNDAREAVGRVLQEL